VQKFVYNGGKKAVIVAPTEPPGLKPLFYLSHVPNNT